MSATARSAISVVRVRLAGAIIGSRPRYCRWPPPDATSKIRSRRPIGTKNRAAQHHAAHGRVGRRRASASCSAER
jgi:hypothetical protein